MKLLVTGGTGYIGSHAVVELIETGHEAVIVDNLANSSVKVLGRIEKITGTTPEFHELDICDTKKLNDIFKSGGFDGVIHFAALKAVGESVEEPLAYYRNNIDGLLSVLECMSNNDVNRLIFSSSCTVYGEATPPLNEEAATTINLPSPYGKTKAMAEQILADAAKSNQKLQITSLRYFNPVGAHPSGLIGEDPTGTPNCLMPYVAQVAVGKLDKLAVFGNDYPTSDGTCIRDYVHVVDLAKGHLAAFNHNPAPGLVDVYNLGTGQGTSVIELVSAFERAAGKKIPYEVVARRSGDITQTFADASKAKAELSWEAKHDIADMCKDMWNWQSKNPDGY